MANSERLIKNNSGQVFIPMNVEGGTWDENFMSVSKAIGLGGMGIFTVWAYIWAYNIVLSFIGYIVLTLIVLFVDSLVLRYVIFQEKYYYKMYKKMKKYEISTPAVFWDIVDINDTEEGATMLYTDMRVGIIFKLERDTITGKPSEFKERHFDYVSDFYKELHLKDLKFVQLNIMEPAGRDPRLHSLDDFSNQSKNENISKLVEMQTGYIKNIARSTLFESDYFLIYTDRQYRSETIIADTIDCIYKLLGGGYINYSILNKQQILELGKNIYGVKYFDYINATMNVFRQRLSDNELAFNIIRLETDSGEEIEIGKRELNLINNLTSCINRGTIKSGEWTIKNTLDGRLSKESTREIEKEVRFNQLGLFDDTSEDDLNTSSLDDMMFGSSFSDIEDNEVQEKTEDILINEGNKSRKKFSLSGKKRESDEEQRDSEENRKQKKEKGKKESKRARKKKGIASKQEIDGEEFKEETNKRDTNQEEVYKEEDLEQEGLGVDEEDEPIDFGY